MAKNIQMNVLGSDGQYEDIYPQTLSENVIDLQDNYYNKNETLTNETAGLFGLDASAVPDDVLALLSRFNSGLGNEYVWDKATVKTSVTTESVAYSAPIYSETTEVKKLFYSDDFEVKSDGYIHLINPGYIEVSPSTISTATLNSTLANKCVTYWNYIGYTYGDAIYRVASSPEAAMTSNQITVKVVERYINPTINVEHVSYVNSPDKSSYPPAEPDEYTYTFLGQIGNKVQIATGFYFGTGTYGVGNPNTLTFDFEPKFLMVSNMKATNTNGSQVFAFAMTEFIGKTYERVDGFYSTSNGSIYNMMQKNGNTINWYINTGNSATMQLNHSGTTYYYIALGTGGGATESPTQLTARVIAANVSNPYIILKPRGIIYKFVEQVGDQYRYSFTVTPGTIPLASSSTATGRMGVKFEFIDATPSGQFEQAPYTSLQVSIPESNRVNGEYTFTCLMDEKISPFNGSFGFKVTPI